MDRFFQDIRYGWRMLAKDPAFTVVIVLMLALGIGANTAVFTIFNATLLRPLPFQKPEELVQVWSTRTTGDFEQFPFSYPNYVDLRDHNQVFSQVGAYSGTTSTIASKQGAEQVITAIATSGFFETLGVQPMLGRTFRPDEDQEHSQPALILTYGGWQRRFGSDPSIVGKTLRLDGALATIVGVLPESFQFGPSQSADFWASARIHGWQVRRNAYWLSPIGRIKEGISLSQAQAGVDAFAHQLQMQYPDSNANVGARIVSARDQLVGSVRPALIALLASVGFVLLITCANVAGLLMARSLARQKEISVRVALGASRGRIARQLLTESVLLGVLGGIVGLLTACWGVPAIVSAIPKQQLLMLPSLQNLTLDRGVLLFCMGLSVLTGIIFGLFPAMQAFKADPQRGLQESGRSSVGTTHSRVRNSLVVVEVSLAVILLAGAGLMLKSLHQLLNVNPGFKTDHLLTLSVALPHERYPDDSSLLAFHQKLLTESANLPGVEHAATINIVPLTSSGNTSRYDLEGHPKGSGGEEYEANSRSISENYFAVMGIPLRSGRFFSSEDTPKSRHVVIVNQALVKQAFPHSNPIGKRINYTYSGEPNLWEIVGVVGDEKVGKLDEQPGATVYTSLTQEPQPYFSLAIRTKQEPAALANSVREKIRQLDSEVPVFEMASMDEIITQSPTMMLHAYPAYLIAGFAGLALLLAGLGIYGLLTYSVTQRTRELGLRMALGAKQRDLLQLVVGTGMKLTLIGVAFGIAVGLALTRLMASLLFGVGPTDFTTFASVTALIVSAAALASYLPARRASRVDPMVALRHE